MTRATSRGHELPALASAVNEATEVPDAREWLFEFLDERSRIFEGRGASEVDRLRGYALATLGELGLSERGPACHSRGAREREESLCGRGRRDCVADAAQASIRKRRATGRSRRALAGRRPQGVVRHNVAGTAALGPDDCSIGNPRHPLLRSRRGTVRTLEAAAVLERLVGAPLSRPAREALDRVLTSTTAERAELPSCCGTAASSSCEVTPAKLPRLNPNVWAALAEDQDGVKAPLGDWVLGRPSVIVFFYTRCMSPEKCSRTISNLAAIQRLAETSGHRGAFNLIGMTYDPSWDVPHRLRTYGADRGLCFTSESRLVRIHKSWSVVRTGFDLAVGYGPATVNRHQVDAFVLDSSGEIRSRYNRRLWTADSVFGSVRGLL